MSRAKLKFVTAVAPSFLASYLVNGDSSGITDSEQRTCDQWTAANDFGPCVGCEDVGFTYWHDAREFFPGAGDCQTYTFQILPPTRVIFRMFKGKLTVSGQCIAIFPDIPEHGSGMYLSYMHIGQHGGCRYPHSGTRPAKPAEYADLLRELQSIGYKLKIVSRIRYNR